MRTERGGFTLIELLVALTIGATVLLGARLLLDGLAAQARATVSAARVADGEANAERIARDAVGNLSLAPDTAVSFAGNENEAAFTSWCASARGGLEPCVVRLAVRERDVVLTLAPGGDIVLRHDASSAALRYLTDAAEGGSWSRQWGRSISTPLAIGIFTERDTLLLRVGERR